MYTHTYKETLDRGGEKADFTHGFYCRFNNLS